MKVKLLIAMVVVFVGAVLAFGRFGSTAEGPTGAAVAANASPSSPLSGAGGSAEPRLTMTTMEHSFGTIKPGTPLKHTFEVKNEGPDVLEIKEVRPSCGCTTTNFDKAIAPGKTGSIALAIEKTESYLGELTKTAVVVTNDPKNSNLTLTLRANFAR